VTGDTATGEVTGVAHHLRVDVDGHDGGTDVIWHLRYVDEYVDTGGAWRIVRRVLHLRGIEERAVPRLGPERPSGEERTLWS
jgi:hypothetical protein